MIVLKCIFLLVAIMYTFSNIVRAFRNQPISNTQIILMAAGIVGFIYLQWWR